MTQFNLKEVLKIQPALAPLLPNGCRDYLSPFLPDARDVLAFMKQNGYFWCLSCMAWVPLENQYCELPTCRECY